MSINATLLPEDTIFCLRHCRIKPGIAVHLIHVVDFANNKERWECAHFNKAVDRDGNSVPTGREMKRKREENIALHWGKHKRDHPISAFLWNIFWTPEEHYDLQRDYERKYLPCIPPGGSMDL